MKLCTTRRVTALLPVILGVLAFFIVVGPRALNPMNIAWLEGGAIQPPIIWAGLFSGIHPGHFR
jgi:hypothetical protein